MKKKKLNEAFEYVDDKYLNLVEEMKIAGRKEETDFNKDDPVPISDFSQYTKSYANKRNNTLVFKKGSHRYLHKYKWIAAILCICLLTGAVALKLHTPTSVNARILAEAEYPEMTPYPYTNPSSDDYATEDGFMDIETYNKIYNNWLEDLTKQIQAAGKVMIHDDFFTQTIPQYLSRSGNENQVFAPVNSYLALAMLAELSDGSCQQQLLTLLNADSLESLRVNASLLWNGCYRDDGIVTSILANSLWLNEDLNFDMSIIKTLKESYYASSYQGKMGSEEYDQMLRNWLDEQTRGLLEEQSEQLQLEPETALALATTIYFQANWSETFLKEDTESGIFHANTGDIICDYMHKSDVFTNYYWSDNFSAVSLSLEAGEVLIILPNENYTIDNLLADERVINFMLYPEEWPNSEIMEANLSIPKFDISSQLNLIDGLKKLGVTDIFDDTVSDLTPIAGENAEKATLVSKIDHNVRVSIDETGCSAAAYTVITRDMGAPEYEKINFTVDRPFIFVIDNSEGISLFTGVVNQP